MTSEWFRNADWNSTIAEQFFQKLKRARRKEQYLLTQAGMLASTYPVVALEMIGTYLSLPDQFAQAQAHVDRATAFLALGKVEDAISAFQAALAREAEFPAVQTGARLQLPLLIATRQLRTYYEIACSTLNSWSGPLLFPADRFMWHASSALIAHDNGELQLAREQALVALEAESLEHSGFRYHPTVGLVSRAPFDVMERLRAIAKA